MNRGNLRATIFHKDADFEAFERILDEGLQIYQVELFSFQWMPNRYHLVLRRLVDSGGVLLGISDTNLHRCFRPGRSPDFLDGYSESTLRYRNPSWQRSGLRPNGAAQRGRPLGDPDWSESIANRFNLESTIRPQILWRHTQSFDIALRNFLKNSVSIKPNSVPEPLIITQIPPTTLKTLCVPIFCTP